MTDKGCDGRCALSLRIVVDELVPVDPSCLILVDDGIGENYALSRVVG